MFHMTRLLLMTALFAAVRTGRLSGQDDDAHHHETLGHVTFPVTCNAEARARFERAMALLHSFWWEEGARAFKAVAVADTTCAMAYWGHGARGIRHRHGLECVGQSLRRRSVGRPSA